MRQNSWIGTAEQVGLGKVAGGKAGLRANARAATCRGGGEGGGEGGGLQTRRKGPHVVHRNTKWRE